MIELINKLQIHITVFATSFLTIHGHSVIWVTKFHFGFSFRSAFSINILQGIFIMCAITN